MAFTQRPYLNIEREYINTTLDPLLYSYTHIQFEREKEGRTHRSLHWSNSNACIAQLETRPCLSIFSRRLRVWTSFFFAGIEDIVGVGLVAIDGSSTTRCRMDFRSRILFSWEKADLCVIDEVVQILEGSFFLDPKRGEGVIRGFAFQKRLATCHFGGS